MVIGMDFLYPSKFILAYCFNQSLEAMMGGDCTYCFLFICPSLSSSLPFLQVNSWKWSLPGPLDPSPTRRPLYLMSYGRFPQGHVTPVFPHAPLQAWPTPSPPPPGEKTLLASARAGPALTPQVHPQYTCVWYKAAKPVTHEVLL